MFQSQETALLKLRGSETNVSSRLIAFDKAEVKKKNSEALVRERTIPTDRPPLVSEVTANFCG
jgi:hypothetical protein